MATPVNDLWTTQRRSKHGPFWRLLLFGTIALALVTHIELLSGIFERVHTKPPLHAAQTLAKCRNLHAIPGPPANARTRVQSDRFEAGTEPYLIRNATIWTGRVGGLEVLKGDVLLDQGLIKAVGHVDNALLRGLKDLVIYDAHGAWVSPGVVDLHSHMGDEPSPALQGANDGNSLKGPILPWLRSVDGLNTHDDSYHLSAAGGITTALILPGSANAIGGEAFAIKIRKTRARTSTSLLVDPPLSLNGTSANGLRLRWRHMKHACGENPARVYGDTRMDTVWKLRQAYDHARQIKQAQDDYCAAAVAGKWTDLGSFPEDLQWEPLVAILRGQVKVLQTHCYETVDITNFVRLSNEFKFSVAAFHHAHEAYLVPEVLRQAYGSTPAIAMFAAFSRYKREAYRHSQYAPRILADEGIDVVMKSDHPAISRTLLHEAQLAHYYGLVDNLALSSVITTPAKVLGLDWRIGYIRDGYDADVVVWDSHPLSLGATPAEVWVDGLPQFKTGFASKKPTSAQAAPKTPDFDQEAADAVKYDGLPPINAEKSASSLVVFVNVATVWTHQARRMEKSLDANTAAVTVAFRDGKLVCAAEDGLCAHLREDENATIVDLEGGAIGPGFISAGSLLGLQEIALEASTVDGPVFDPLLGPVPEILGGSLALIKAVDGLQFETRDALLAYRAGVTVAVSAPAGAGLISGLSAAFSLGAASKADEGAVIRNVVALHVKLSMEQPYSVSTQIATLRYLLLHAYEHEHHSSHSSTWSEVVSTHIPLVIEVNSADIIATVLSLKKEVEDHHGSKIKITLLGGAESHLLAKEIAEAGVGVIVTPPRSFPSSWESRRILPGPPISAESLVTTLVRHNVTVALGAQGVGGAALAGWAVQNARWDAGWAMLESNGTITEQHALELISTNVEKLVGLDFEDETRDLIAVKGGGLLSFEGKVVGVASPRRGRVDIF